MTFGDYVKKEKKITTDNKLARDTLDVLPQINLEALGKSLIDTALDEMKKEKTKALIDEVKDLLQQREFIKSRLQSFIEIQNSIEAKLNKLNYGKFSITNDCKIVYNKEN